MTNLKRILATALALCMALCLVPTLTGGTRVAEAAATTFTGVDTLLIYNPLIYDDDQSITNTLSSGDMTGQISTSGSNVRGVPHTSESSPFTMLSQDDVASMFDPANTILEEEAFTPATRAVSVGTTQSFKVQRNVTTGTMSTLTFTARAVGDHCIIWGYGTEFSSTSIASSMATEFDNTIYAADLANFGSARFIEDGDKLNVLVYTISSSGSGTILGYFWGVELYSASDWASSQYSTYASTYNVGMPIIHINASACTTTYLQSAVYPTLAHEFQHLINYTSSQKNSNNSTMLNETTMGTWLNESMSMQAEELIYPSVVADEGYISDCYNVSGDIAGGQSLYNFATANDIGVYGQVFLWSEYMKQQAGSSSVFGTLHSNWRTCSSSGLNDGANIYNAINTYSTSAVSSINSHVSYPTTLVSQINSTDGLSSTATTNATSTSIFVSKMNLAFQIATYLRDATGVYSLTAVCSESNPKLTTASSVSIEGGGRIWVKTADEYTYSVPSDASPYLVYTGFKDGAMVFGPCVAADYEPTTDPAAWLSKGSYTFVAGMSGALTINYQNLTPTNVAWTTTDASIASVSAASGETITVTAHATGTATITCTVTYSGGTISKTCTVNVRNDAEYYVQTTTITAGDEYLIAYNDGATTYVMGNTVANSSNSRMPYCAAVGTIQATDGVYLYLTDTANVTSLSNARYYFTASGTSWTIRDKANSKYACYDSEGYLILSSAQGSYGVWSWTTNSGTNDGYFKNANWTSDAYYYFSFSPSNSYVTCSTATQTLRLYKKTDAPAITCTHANVTTTTVAATCTTAGSVTVTCNDCGEVVSTTVVDALGHDYVLTSGTAATCTTAGSGTYTCSRCGDTYTGTVAALGHDYVGEVTTAATCTEAGVTTYTCSRCGDTYAEAIAALGHNWAAQTGADCLGSYTIQVCTRCGVTGEKTYAPNTGYYRVNAFTAGNKYLIVANYSGTYYAISAYGYNSDSTSGMQGVVVTVAGTNVGDAVTGITTSGYTYANLAWTAAASSASTANFTLLNSAYSTRYLSSGTYLTRSTTGTATAQAWNYNSSTMRMTNAYRSTSYNVYFYQSVGQFDFYSSGSYGPFDMYLYEYQESAGGTGAHTWDAGAVTTAATCTTDGVKTFTCTVCGATQTETITATGHTAVTDAAVAATCTETGLTAGSHCSVCGEILTAQETIAALGHSYDSGVITTAAACTGDGVKTYTCSRCGETYTEAIAATGHTSVTDAAVAATCTTTGLTAGSHCSVCGETIVAQEVVPALGHTLVYTSNNDGTHNATCSTCGEQLVTNEACTYADGVCTLCGYTQPATGLKGDVNCDGSVNAQDAKALLLYVTGGGTLTAQGILNAETDNVSSLTSNDAKCILAYITGTAWPV